METTMSDTDMFSNSPDGQYLDIPQLSEAAVESRLRHLIRHRLGKCMDIGRNDSPEFGEVRRESGNTSPCEFCLQERLCETLTRGRFVSEDMTFLDTNEDRDAAILKRLSSSKDKGRRQSLQISDMYISNRSRVYKPWTRSFRFTKEELSAFLPRKSFFSCHDKALKDAGYDETPVKRRHGRRQNKDETKEKAGSIGSEVTREENSQPASDEPGKEQLLPTIVITAMEPAKEGSRPSSPVHGDGGKSQSAKSFSSKARLARKKMEDEFHKNEHKAITDYLKYVQDNPAEYIEHIRQLEAAEVQLKPVERLIKTAMIYQRGHHGQKRASLVVRASHDLKLRYADPGQWQHVNKERNQMLSQVFNYNKKDKKESVANKPSQDGDKDGKQDQEEGKTELERSRYKAEKWLKTVPMSQQLKARQMALEEVGEEDVEATQWWEALRTCHYIRNIGLANNSTAPGHKI